MVCMKLASMAAFMADRLPIFYWDTCILMERVKGEKIPPPQQRAIQQILDDNKNKKNRIVTSALTSVHEARAMLAAAPRP